MPTYLIRQREIIYYNNFENYCSNIYKLPFDGRNVIKTERVGIIARPDDDSMRTLGSRLDG